MHTIKATNAYGREMDSSVHGSIMVFARGRLARARLFIIYIPREILVPALLGMGDSGGERDSGIDTTVSHQSGQSGVLTSPAF